MGSGTAHRLRVQPGSSGAHEQWMALHRLLVFGNLLLGTWGPCKPGWSPLLVAKY